MKNIYSYILNNNMDSQHLLEAFNTYAIRLASNTDFIQTDEDKIDIYKLVGQFQDTLKDELYIKIDSKSRKEDEFLEILKVDADYGSNNNLLVDISFRPEKIVSLSKKDDLILFTFNDNEKVVPPVIDEEVALCKIYKDRGEMTDRYFHINGVDFPITHYKLNKSTIEISCDLLNYET